MNTTYIATAVISLMKPLVRFLLKSGIGFATFAEWAKQAYVSVAEDEFPSSTGKQSGSRIATITGLHRKEVARLRELLSSDQELYKPVTANRAQRVVNLWLQNEDYLDDKNQPLVIDIKGVAPSFECLVKAASGDIPQTTILDELVMSGIVELVGVDQIKMRQLGYIPAEDRTEKLKIMGQSASDLLSTLEHNLDINNESPRLQMSVAYKHLSPETVEEFKKFSREESKVLLLKLNAWLAERDGLKTDLETEKDNANASEELRAGLGIYYFEENVGCNNEAE